MPETILALGAHNDDHLICAGGTFAKYAKEGKNVKSIIFSFGEKSHPHLKPEIIQEQRIEEAVEADKILGIKGTAFYGLCEGRFPEEFKEKNIKQKLRNILHKEKPVKIFTHSDDDIHPDHRAVSKLVLELVRESGLNCNVYSFDVWNVVKLKQRNLPKLVVDVTQTFGLKTKAFKAHKSQYNLPAVIALRWKMHVQAIIHGWNNHCKYAEVFYKLN